MLTPQEIDNKDFVKAIFGGYDMATVDDFLEEVSESYAALHKENVVLKSKIKVLVEKVEEYRSTEDAMRMALVTAKKTGDELLGEAKERSEAILADAEKIYQERVGRIHTQVEEEEYRLRLAREKTAEFISTMEGFYQDQMDFLAKIDKLKLPSPPPVAKKTIEERDPREDTAVTIEKSVSKIFKEEEDEKTAAKKKNMDETKRVPDTSQEEIDRLSSTKARLNFENLQFGNNYEQAKK